MTRRQLLIALLAAIGLKQLSAQFGQLKPKPKPWGRREWARLREQYRTGRMGPGMNFEWYVPQQIKEAEKALAPVFGNYELSPLDRPCLLQSRGWAEALLKDGDRVTISEDLLKRIFPNAVGAGSLHHGVLSFTEVFHKDDPRVFWFVCPPLKEEVSA